ncbi:type I restriction-modification system subunit M [Deinococcus enclensis]|uniref:site-specific DNA-methyltransferase (adenine-specific) n=1 Tax=Deinococcus enclensis TaxID=1049582 RepID=A0ABT9MHU6_9DEIO|nr:type I restriction-modification system subunit M [Deinococcus enclensis]MDP9766158.1 type I restriction enzyme M protein [Deinococcus enclensis]
MTDQQRNELGRTLWAIADKLRGAMNADDFRDYMLAFLFLRYLSENYESAARKELGADWPDLEDGRNALQVFYDRNRNDWEEFEDLMRKRVHYVIEPQHLWSNIVQMARRDSPDLLTTLREGFEYIEEKSFGGSFAGLFSEINLDSEKLGKSYGERNKKLASIVSKIADGLSDFSTDTDTLGDAYEYLIAQFAAGSGKKAGEFYTPQEVSSVLSGIVALDSHDPKQGNKKHLKSVMDMACGSGSLLLNVRRTVEADGGSIGTLYGQEKNITTYNLARMNMLLHGVKDTEFDIFHGDTLENEWPMLREENPARKPQFDAIVANPPFSLRWEPGEATAQDIRFKSHGVAPKSAADFAFLLHGFHYLSEQGTMAIILPHGVLFRGGAEERIRRKLLDDGHIDTIIGLPSNLFYSTGIPVAILVLKKCKQFDDVLFINASGEGNYGKKKRQNELRAQDIKKIVGTYRERTEESHYSRRVSLAEIRDEHGYNLNITRYVSTDKAKDEVSLEAVHTQLTDIEKRIQDATKAHNKFLRELGLPPLV